MQVDAVFIYIKLELRSFFIRFPDENISDFEFTTLI